MTQESVNVHSTRLPPSVARGAPNLDTDPPTFRIPATPAIDSSRQNTQGQSQKLLECLSLYRDITGDIANAQQLAAAGPVQRAPGEYVRQRANSAAPIRATRISARPQVDAPHQIEQSQGKTRLQGDLTFK
jgi:hypothetical protein